MRSDHRRRQETTAPIKHNANTRRLPQLVSFSADTGSVEARHLRRLHAALTPGRGELAKLRGWDRLLRYCDHGSRTARLKMLAALAAAPLLSFRHSWRSVRSHGVAVEARYGVSRINQFFDQWRLRWHYGIAPEMYYLYRMHLPDRRSHAHQFVQVDELTRVTRLVVARCCADDASILADKRRFAQWSQDNELRGVETLIEFEPDGKVLRSAALPKENLFAKMADGAYGSGAQMWTYVPGGNWTGQDGITRNEDELLDAMRALSISTRRPFLLQRCLANHQALRHLTTGALATIRILTIREPAGDPFVLMAAQRMPLCSTVVDNLEQGGMASPVDLETGQLGVAVRMNSPLFDECDRHPVTGKRISGTVIPFWRDVLSLVLRGHRSLPRMPMIGWDVAVLDDGPVLIEGNRFPSPRVNQVAGGVPLGETSLVACLNQHLAASFGLRLEDVGSPSTAD